MGAASGHGAGASGTDYVMAGVGKIGSAAGGPKGLAAARAARTISKAAPRDAAQIAATPTRFRPELGYSSQDSFQRVGGRQELHKTLGQVGTLGASNPLGGEDRPSGNQTVRSMGESRFGTGRAPDLEWAQKIVDDAGSGAGGESPKAIAERRHKALWGWILQDLPEDRTAPGKSFGEIFSDGASLRSGTIE